jgi:aldose sugar dehydrogenase
VALGIGAAVTSGQDVAWAAPANPSADSPGPSAAGPPGSTQGKTTTGPARKATSGKHRSVGASGSSGSGATGSTTADAAAPASTPGLGTGRHSAVKSAKAPASSVVAKNLATVDAGTTTGSTQQTGDPGGAVVDPVDSNAGTAKLTATATTTKSLVTTTVAKKVPAALAVSTVAAKQAAVNPVTSFLSAVGLGALANSNPLAPFTPSGLLSGLLEWARREFNNQTPTIKYDPSQNVAENGTITGKVVGVDPDSSKLTYTVSQPADGSVVIHSDGTFTYTPSAEYTGSDSFKVTVSDAASGLQIHGLSGLLNLVTFGLLGDSGHTVTERITVSGDVPPATGTPTGFETTPIVTGLDGPTDFRFLPDGRILIAEKGGAIKVATSGGQVQSNPVVTIPVDSDFSRGVEGLAVDPNFAQNGRIYVAYINTNHVEQLSRFTTVTDPGTGAITVVPNSEKVLVLGTETAADDHFGGTLAFGPDGDLYWGVGDNGYFVDNAANISQDSQNLGNIYGKVLRINPDGTVPSNNPYVGVAGALPQIYANGFRNPFRGNFTPTGKLLVGDVGQTTWEEIDLVTAGGNYGWPLAEGVCPGAGECDPGVVPGQLVNPIYTYNHDGGSNSITAVLPYSGATFGPAYQNTVFFADFSRGWIEYVTCNGSYTSCGNPTMFNPNAGSTVSLQEGPDGAIYQLTLDGTISRIAPSDDPATLV